MSNLSGRKINQDYENPFDNFYIQLSEQLGPLFYKYNFSANDITTISSIFGVLSIYALIYKKYIASGLFYFLQYFFDCMDGNYARRYGFVSKFGDTYDHIKDWTINLLLIYIFYRRKLWTGLGIMLGTVLCTPMQFGCQEVLYNKDESPLLEFTKQFSPCSDQESAKKYLPYLKLFGCGTWNTLISIYLMSLKFIKT